jgi:hypothetical protein
VRYDGADHVVVALAGTSVRLRSDDGLERVVLAGHLMACPEFTVAGGGRLPEAEPSGLLEGLPARVLEKAREWERHVVEARTGLPPDAPAEAVPRPGSSARITQSQPGAPGSVTHSMIRPLRHWPWMRTHTAAWRGPVRRSRQPMPGPDLRASGMLTIASIRNRVREVEAWHHWVRPAEVGVSSLHRARRLVMDGGTGCSICRGRGEASWANHIPGGAATHITSRRRRI